MTHMRERSAGTLPKQILALFPFYLRPASKLSEALHWEAQPRKGLAKGPRKR